MPRKPSYRIEALAPHHDRTCFSCGNAALDDYLRQRVGQDRRRFATVAYVLVAQGSPEVLGYYTLSALSVDFGEMPNGIVKKLPRYPAIPVTMLGRLAVDQSVRKSGLGEFLLLDALQMSLRQADKIGSAGVVVDAIDNKARSFYLHYGFIALKDRRDRLFLPMKTIALLFS